MQLLFSLRRAAKRKQSGCDSKRKLTGEVHRAHGADQTRTWPLFRLRSGHFRTRFGLLEAVKRNCYGFLYFDRSKLLSIRLDRPCFCGVSCRSRKAAQNSKIHERVANFGCECVLEQIQRSDWSDSVRMANALKLTDYCHLAAWLSGAAVDNLLASPTRIFVSGSRQILLLV